MCARRRRGSKDASKRSPRMCWCSGTPTSHSNNRSAKRCISILATRGSSDLIWNAAWPFCTQDQKSCGLNTSGFDHGRAAGLARSFPCEAQPEHGPHEQRARQDHNAFLETARRIGDAPDDFRGPEITKEVDHENGNGHGTGPKVDRDSFYDERVD